MIRKIKAERIKDTVKELLLQANYEIGTDILEELSNSLNREESATGKSVLQQIIDNHQIARQERIAICQDTGMAVVFVNLGQEVHITGGDFTEAVNQGVKEAYTEGYLRKSVVEDPLFGRKNTGDNTPAVIHLELVPGDKVKIQVMTKGFGSENMSRGKMLLPSAGVQGVTDFVIETVQEAGPNPCPPLVIGVGIGGTLEMAARIAKIALMREIGHPNSDSRYAVLEKELKERVNELGIGPAGLGGRITALAVNVEYYPTHIAGLPVVVNINCHAARHTAAEI